MVHGSDCHSPKLNIRFWFLPLFAGNWLIGRYVRSIHNLTLFCFLEFTLFNIRLLVHQAILIYDMVIRIRWETDTLELSIDKEKDLIQLCNKRGVFFIFRIYSLWNIFPVEYIPCGVVSLWSSFPVE